SQEVRFIFGMFRKSCDSETRGKVNGQPFFFQKSIAANGVSNPMGDPVGRLDVGLRKNNDKLVPSVTGDDIDISQTFNQKLRHFDQNLTSHQMPMLIVHQFEMVHIEENQ